MSKRVIGAFLVIGSLFVNVNADCAADFVNRGSETVLVEAKPRVVLESNSGNAQTGVYVSSDEVNPDGVDYTPSQEKNNVETSVSPSSNADQKSDESSDKVKMQKVSLSEKIGKWSGLALGLPAAVGIGLFASMTSGIFGVVSAFEKGKKNLTMPAMVSFSLGTAVAGGVLYSFYKLGGLVGRFVDRLFFSK